MKKKENLTRRYLPYRMLAFIAEDKGNSGALYNYKLMIVTLERPSIVKLTRDSVEIHQRLSKDHKYLEEIKKSQSIKLHH